MRCYAIFLLMISFSCNDGSKSQFNDNNINFNVGKNNLDSIDGNVLDSIVRIKQNDLNIDSLIKSINSDKILVKRDTSCFDISSEGAEVTLFSKKSAEFNKAIVTIYGSIGKSHLELYNYDSTLRYVYIKTFIYDSSISSKNNKIIKTDEERLYFKGGVLERYFINSELVANKDECNLKQKQIIRVYNSIKAL